MSKILNIESDCRINIRGSTRAALPQKAVNKKSL